MPRACPQCGAQLPDIASFCSACGNPIAEARPQLGTTGVLRDKLAGALAYVTFIPAIIFLLVEPFKRNRFIRFHSFQSIFLTIAAVAIAIALRIAFVVLLLIPVLGHFMVLLLVMVAWLGAFILWIVLLVKTLQGEFFKLPAIGDLAEKQADLSS